MHIKIETHVSSNRWMSYPELLEKPYLESLVYDTIISSKYKDLFNEVDLTFSFSNNKEIMKINKEMRNKDTPTNVISVQVEDFFDSSKKKQYIYLGDIILSVEKIEEEAQNQGKSFINHCTHLIVHGILHLMGYNHVIEEDIMIMESIEIEVLKKRNIASPY